MFVEAVFWFHPLVWWIGARLLEERERACDEEVLRLTRDPKAYADAILNVCKQYVASPLGCVPGVSGSNLKKRIEAIMADRMVPKLNLAKKAVIAAAGIAAFVLPVLVGVINTSSISVRSLSAQSVERVRFVTASIRPNTSCGDARSSTTAGGKTGAQRKSNGGDAGPGALNVHCATLGGETGLIRLAYIVFATGHANHRLPSPTLSSGPDWLESERFDIEAKADGDPSGELMRGPMMQTILEDKLKLKVRLETRESPAYALVPSGDAHRLQAFEEGSCTPRDLSKPLAMRPTPDVKYCSFFVGVTPSVGPMPTAEAMGATLHDFAMLLSMAVDRPVIDATGIPGRYNFHLEFAPDANTPTLLDLRRFVSEAAVAALPTILTAIQEHYGLKLVPSQAPREFLVVDHVEKPSSN